MDRPDFSPWQLRGYGGNDVTGGASDVFLDPKGIKAEEKRRRKQRPAGFTHGETEGEAVTGWPCSYGWHAGCLLAVCTCGCHVVRDSGSTPDAELTTDEYDNLTRWPTPTVLGCEHMTFTSGATVDRLSFGCGCIPRITNVTTSGRYL